MKETEWPKGPFMFNNWVPMNEKLTFSWKNKTKK